MRALALQFMALSLLAADSMQSAWADSIDRRALVSRHNPELRKFDPENPLSVGNGEFAFTADATGLQTFAAAFEKTTPLGTLSQWGWHTIPNTNEWSIEKFHFNELESHGRKIGYADIPSNQRTPEINWLRSNPHRLHLGRLAFVLKKKDGSLSTAADLADIHQMLDLWNGELVSEFKFEDSKVEVHTVCNPERDSVSVRVVSPLVKNRRLAIQIAFPYGTGEVKTADWNHPEAHETTLARLSASSCMFTRKLDQDEYYAAVRWSQEAELIETDRHEYTVRHSDKSDRSDLSDAIEFTLVFSAVAESRPVTTFQETREAARRHWNNFWSTGGAIDLSASNDPRWCELERRIVLSQYLTAIQCAGKLPPQETGLTYNSWEGKFHLEMHWWHAAHFALWNRLSLLEKSLPYYANILPRAQGTARRQGYAGARWPKMTGPTGAESPSPVGPFLIWQQPHPIYYAELCYRAHPERATLEKFKEVILQTAEFMTSYAAWDEETKRFVLGPPLQCAQEIFPKERTLNPTYELTYWRWGLETAQRWQERLGLSRNLKWDKVLRELAKPTIVDGKYLFAETAPQSFSDKKWANDHPSVLAAYGFLPPFEDNCIDAEVMRHTLDWVWANWNWPDTWGWDYPMVAMTAARLGQPERAIDALLHDTPKNHYGINGHNYQRPGLSIYLPGNGGLLYAAAMMAAGWEGCAQRQSPGFPTNGQWTVRWEKLSKAP